MTTKEQIGACIAPELIHLLTEVFPVKNPKPGVSMDQMLFDAGRANAVQYLSECYTAAQRR